MLSENIPNIKKNKPNKFSKIDSLKNNKEQINIIKPKVLVLLGKVAANRLLGEDMPMSELRLKKFFIDKYDIPIIVFYHPAYILRSPSQKKKVWDDLQYLKGIIDSNVS